MRLRFVAQDLQDGKPRVALVDGTVLRLQRHLVRHQLRHAHQRRTEGVLGFRGGRQHGRVLQCCCIAASDCQWALVRHKHVFSHRKVGLSTAIFFKLREGWN